MIKKKILLLGSFAVGKTSLVQRYVHSVFSEKYHTTIGVKIDQKDVIVNGTDIRFIIWDIHGEDDFQKIHTSYLTGASGFLLVADLTRKSTLYKAAELKDYVQKAIQDVPFLLLLNKSDLKDEYDIDEQELNKLNVSASAVIRTSAKTGEGVEDAFLNLAKVLL